MLIGLIRVPRLLWVILECFRQPLSAGALMTRAFPCGVHIPTWGASVKEAPPHHLWVLQCLHLASMQGASMHRRSEGDPNLDRTAGSVFRHRNRDCAGHKVSARIRHAVSVQDSYQPENYAGLACKVDS